MGDRKRHKILFAGGGTGGHLMPAINIALALREIDKDIDVLFVGKRDGMEKGIVTRFDFAISEIEAVPMRRSVKGVINFILNWNKGVKQAAAVLREFNPQVVVGTGGYVSGPVVRMAHKMQIPIYMQEQNSLPGLATRTLSQMAESVFIAYEGATKYISKEKCRMVGNPVRPDLLNATRDDGIREFSLDSSRKTILILGGSSGARGINNAIIDVIRMGVIPENWQLLWQIGQKDFSETAAVIPDKFRGKYLPFIHNMPAAYASADLVISRSGAMALAEIAVWGLPSILIPYPYATGDHQSINAREFAESGAAVVIPEKSLPDMLASVISGMVKDDEKRNVMARGANTLARPDAANNIAKIILDKINEVQTH
jgi:UDP-N-acetylglucosamine--N-acetylmuramyl-(pentapeptide) pyrophosphoryl-undecaprenol N-acetylglucosamine transferase